MCVKYNNSRVLHSDAYYKVSGVLHHSKQTSGTMNMKRVVSKLDCWLDGRVENASCCPLVSNVLRRQGGSGDHSVPCSQPEWLEENSQSLWFLSADSLSAEYRIGQGRFQRSGHPQEHSMCVCIFEHLALGGSLFSPWFLIDFSHSEPESEFGVLIVCRCFPQRVFQII